MSIEKYLENIKLSDKHPGPFSVRLKYQLQKEFFEKRSRFGVLSLVTSAAAFVFFIMSTVFVVNPTVAQSIHYVFNKNADETNRLENIVFVDEGEFLGQKSRYGNQPNTIQGEFFKVSDLSNLDKNKSYIIKKVQGRSESNVFYVSEIKGQSKPKIIY